MISIHAPRERSDDELERFTENDCISIHAPRERSDIIIIVSSSIFSRISIHAPRERSDPLR